MKRLKWELHAWAIGTSGFRNAKGGRDAALAIYRTAREARGYAFDGEEVRRVLIVEDPRRRRRVGKGAP